MGLDQTIIQNKQGEGSRRANTRQQMGWRQCEEHAGRHREKGFFQFIFKHLGNPDHKRQLWLVRTTHAGQWPIGAFILGSGFRWIRTHLRLFLPVSPIQTRMN